MSKISITLCILILLPFLVACLDYDPSHTVSCQDIKNTDYTENLNFLW